MKKSEVLAVPPIGRKYRKGDAEWYAAGKNVKLSDGEAFIIDIYHFKKPVVRYVLGKEQYLTYIFTQKKWSRAKIASQYYYGNINFYEYDGDSRYKTRRDAAASSVVKAAYGDDWISGVAAEQVRIENERDIANRQLAAKKALETAEAIPEMGKPFRGFVEKDWNESIVWTFTQDDRTFLSCSYCGKRDVVSGTLKKSKKIKCAYCGHAGIAQKEKDYESVIMNERYYNDVRPYQKGIAIVAVKVTKTQRISYPVSFKYDEAACMVFLPKRKTPDEYWIEGGKWKKGVKKERHYSGYGHQNKSFPIGSCPGYAADVLASSGLKYTGWSHYGAELYRYLREWQQNPEIELLAKAGLKKLITYNLNCISGVNGIEMNKDARGFADKLGILSERKKMLIDAEGDPDLLYALRLEREIGRMKPETIQAIAAAGRRYFDDIRQIARFVPIDRAFRYLGTQTETDLNPVNIYSDYLRMRETRGYPMTERLYPRDLVAAHNELVGIDSAEKNKESIRKYEKEYPKVKASYRRLNRIFKYQTADFVIRPARDCGEIVKEGAALHHCVGSSDTYISRYNEGQSYILFLRRRSKAKIPYATIEIGADYEIRQWYEAYDQKPDAAVIQPVLDKYVAHLKEAV